MPYNPNKQANIFNKVNLIIIIIIISYEYLKLYNIVHPN